MKLLYISVIAVLMSSLCALAILKKSKKPDFDASMRLAEYPDLFAQNESYPKVYEMLKHLYNKNYVEKVPADAPYKIPKILHQIWLGSSFPEKYVAFRDTWLKNHPDWEYKLWTEKEIDELGLTNQELYNYAINYGERSDIAKYEIIYRFGGSYIDTDYESYKPLDDIHKAYDFYLGIQPLDTGHVQIGLGLFGARPGHPLLKTAIDEIGKKDKKIEAIVLRTGPLFFTLLFYHLAPQCTDRVIALPAGFVYPMGYQEKAKDKSTWLRPESIANHHWAGSWLSDDAFIPH